MDEAPRRPWKKIAIALVVATVVIAVSWVAWEVFVRPRTIREVIEGEVYQPGETVTVAGTITRIHREETSYGPAVYLELDDYRYCTGNGTFAGGVRGEPSASYRVGDRFETVLHFSSYRLNGDPAVWAPELVCPFPSLLRAIGAVVDSLSYLGGILLVYNGTDSSGWSMYEIATTWGSPYRAEVLPVTLRKSLSIQGNNPELPQGATINTGGEWITMSAVQYVLTSGKFVPCPVVDSMGSLANAPSQNGTLRFVDANANGLVDDGDHLDAFLPPTTENAYDTYMIQIGEANGTNAAYVYGGHYVLNGPGGPLETLASSRADQRVVLRYAGSQIGSSVTTSLEVARVWFGSPPPISELGWSVSVNGTYSRGNFSGLPATLPNGVTLAFLDAGATGVLDTGDHFVVGNLPNRTSAHFGLIHAPENVQIEGLEWIAGYGTIVGLFPKVTLTSRGSSPYQVDVNVSFWHPEFAFNQSVRVSLWENSLPVVTDAVLGDGIVGTFPNGTLSFADADADGFLSSGDSLAIQGNPTAGYRLEISVSFGERYWTTYF